MTYRIVFMGTPEFSVPILEQLQIADFETVLVISQPDRPQGRKREMIPTPVAAKARELGLPLWQPEKVKDLTFLERIRDARPDFIVTAAYGRILTSLVLAVPRFGAVNVHASLLPAYRGASPVHWSIINGDAITGISIMLMDEEMDHGDILARYELEIPEYITTDLLMLRLGELGAETLPKTLISFAKGEITPEEQDHQAATYVKPLTRDEGLIDWNQNSFQIHNLVRGTYPWPGAYTTLNGKRFKIHRSRVEDYPEEEMKRYGRDARPGTVIYSHKDNLLVACGEGVLALLEVQQEGSRRLPVEDISHNIDAGTVFGLEDQAMSQE